MTFPLQSLNVADKCGRNFLYSDYHKKDFCCTNTNDTRSLLYRREKKGRKRKGSGDKRERKKWRQVINPESARRLGI